MKVIGMVALDLFRIEGGFIIGGIEYDPTVSPYECGLGWSVDLDKGDFQGREALARDKEATQLRLTSVVLESGGDEASGAPLWVDDEEVGLVTQAVVSPYLGGRTLGLAKIRKDLNQPGQNVVAQVGEEQVRRRDRHPSRLRQRASARERELTPRVGGRDDHLAGGGLQALRLDEGGHRRLLRRAPGPLPRLAGAERLRQDDPDPLHARPRAGERGDDPRPRTPHPRGGPRGARAGGRDRRGAALLPVPVRPSEPPGLGELLRRRRARPGRLGPRTRQPDGAGQEPGEAVLARDATAPGRRAQPAQRPRAPHPRRAEQRPRPRGDGRVPRHDPLVRGRRRTDGLRLVPPPRRGAEDRRRHRDREQRPPRHARERARAAWPAAGGTSACGWTTKPAPVPCSRRCPTSPPSSGPTAASSASSSTASRTTA